MQQHPEYSVAPTSALTKLTNLTGAAVSLALVVGIGVWGYKLLVRDVTGIPIVRAVAGEMRVRPESPGGQLAQNQGLSVNNVAQVGSSEALANEVKLAPQPTDLIEEDQPLAKLQEATAEAEPAPAVAVDPTSVEGLVAQLVGDGSVVQALDGEDVPILASLELPDASEVLAGPGLRVSLRPTVRPARDVSLAVAINAAVAPVAAAGNLEIDASALPVGTRLVQLGAFDTPDLARETWGQLNTRFSPFMAGKKRIVMEAKSGGRTFYRLRVQGFDDIGDARRFCSALVAENVDCIPVVTR